MSSQSNQTFIGDSRQSQIEKLSIAKSEFRLELAGLIIFFLFL